MYGILGGVELLWGFCNVWAQIGVSKSNGFSFVLCFKDFSSTLGKIGLVENLFPGFMNYKKSQACIWFIVKKVIHVLLFVELVSFILKMVLILSI